MPMFKHPSLFLALLALWLFPTVRPVSAAEWDVGVAAHTGAHGQLRPCT